jgi:FkbM family methyltransferase
MGYFPGQVRGAIYRKEMVTAAPRYYGEYEEDRKLEYYLGRRGKCNDVYYIDVGACDANTDSVTKLFYERGGHGINVEPVRQFWETLVQHRSRDINLNVACSNLNGLLKFHYLAGTGLSTAVDDWAEWQRTHYGRQHETIEVPCLMLGEICRAYVPEIQQIDFLKIDAEGWELQVIEGGDWSRYRPTVVVAEAIIAGTGAPFWEHWEPMLLAAGYEFLEMDNANRWYRVK